MKKVFIAFLTVFLIMLAIAAVQAYAVPLLPALQVTTDVNSPVVTITVTDENKNEGESTDVPAAAEEEETPEPAEVPEEPEEEETPEPADVPEEPEEEEIPEPTEEPTEDAGDEAPEPTEEPTEDAGDEIPEPTEEPTEDTGDETPEPTADPTEDAGDETPESTEEPTEDAGDETPEPTEESTEIPGDETPEPTAGPTEDAGDETPEPTADSTEIPVEETPEPTEEPTEIVTEEVNREVFVTIKGNNLHATYDGARHAASGYTVTGISNDAYTEGDFIFTGQAYAELIDAGVSYMGLTDHMFINKNNEFDVYFVIEDGYVEVSPINVEVEIIGMMESVEYDGNTHAVDGYTFRQIFPVGLEVFTGDSFEFTGDAYAERSEVGVSFMGLNGGSFRNVNPNFGRVMFHVTDGYIEVTPSEEMWEEVDEPAEVIIDEEEEPTPEPTEMTEDEVEPTAEPTETIDDEVEPTAEPTETTEDEVEPTAEPTETIDDEVELTAEPTETTEDEVEPTAEPTETTEDEVEPTAEPTETIDDEVEPTEEPTETTEDEVEPTAEPTETIEDEVEPTAEPTETTEDEVEPTAVPTETTEDEVEPTLEPTEITEDEVEPTAEPTETTEDEAEPTAEPTETTEDEVEPTEVPTEITDDEAESTPEPTETTDDKVELTEEPAGTTEDEVEPTEEPTETIEDEVEPTEEPTETPEDEVEPTEEPTETIEDEVEPTEEPTETPEDEVEPTEEPTETPEDEIEPTEEPTETPEDEVEPTEEPTETPEVEVEPTEEPTETPEDEVEPTPVPEIQTMVFAADTVIYASDSVESDVIMTLEEETEFVVLNISESGWVEIQLGEDASGFVAPAAEESEESGEDVIEVPESEIDNVVILAAGTVIYSDADAASDVLMTLEEETEFVVVETELTGWLEIKLGEETTGFVMTEEAEEESDEESKEPAEVVSLAAGTVIYALEEDAEFAVVNRDESGWLEIKLDEGTTGFVMTEEAEEDSKESVEVVTLTAGTVIYAAADETSEVLKTLEEDAEFEVVNRDESGWLEIRLGEETTGFVMTEEAEEDSKEPAEVVTLTAGTVIYAAADETSEVLKTLEEDAEFVVINRDESGWLEIKLGEETTGFVMTGEADSAEVVTLTAGTVIYAAADETSEVLKTLEEDAEFVVVSKDETGWLEIKLDEETTGFVVEPEEDSDVDDGMLNVSVGTNVRAAADGMSEIIYTFEEDGTAKVISREGDWLLVEVTDGPTGYIFRGDVLTDEEKDPDADNKVLIFTSRRIVMPMGEEIKLTSLLEGFEEDQTILYQWECNKGNGFEPIDGANGDSYSYEATVESLTWGFRLIVRTESDN